MIEVNEFPELADRYQVRAVPLTVIGDKVSIPGAMDPDALVEQVVKAGDAEASEAVAAPGPTSAVAAEEAPRAPQRGSSGRAG